MKFKLNKQKLINFLPAFFTGLLLAAALIEIVYFLQLKPFYYPLNITQEDLQVSFTKEDSLDRKIKNMSLDEKIGKLFMIGINGTTLDKETIEHIQEHYFSNFLLLEKNIESEEQLKQLTLSLNQLYQARQGYSAPGAEYSRRTWSWPVDQAISPVIIAIDQEGGGVSRINFNNIDNTAQADIKDPIKARQVAQNRGEVLKSLGINMNLSPVLEIIRDDKSYITKAKRAFIPTTQGCACSRPSNEEQVLNLGQAMIDGYQKIGIIPIAKHFPGGLGRTKLDPHLTLPSLNISTQELEKDLFPYKHLIISNSIKAIMATHLLYPQIDSDYPASLSKTFLSSILRDKLGFKGVIIIDDLKMKSISANFQIDKASLQAFKAGADLLIISSDYNDQKQAFEFIKNRVLSNQISENRINNSVKNILKLLKT